MKLNLKRLFARSMTGGFELVEPAAPSPRAAQRKMTFVTLAGILAVIGALEHFPFAVNRRDSHWAANRILWSSQAEEAGNGVFERFTSSSDPGC